VTTPPILTTHPLIEEILDAHADRARGDAAGFAGYRGHVYRVFNLARGVVDDADDRDDKLAIAAAFHDIEAFAGLDYLAPSIDAQDAWLERTGRSEWSEELAVVVAQHHRFGTYRGRHARLAEPLRRADLADLSQGLIRSGIPKDQVRAVRGAFDVGCSSPAPSQEQPCATSSATRWTRCRTPALAARSSGRATTAPTAEAASGIRQGRSG